MMRIRHQFVSNSSSSSFVMVGFKEEGNWEELQEKYKLNTGRDAVPYNCVYLDGEGYILGLKVHDFDDQDYGVYNTNLNELEVLFERVSLRFNVPKSMLELYYGTVSN